MINLNRLKMELSGKNYFPDNTYTEILDENGLDSLQQYSKENDNIAMLESTYAVLQMLANDVNAYTKVETEFTTVSAAYQYLQKRLSDVRAEINRIKEDNGTSDRVTSYLFFNN